MHNYTALEEDIRNEVWSFERIEKLRTACSRRLTHLSNRRRCLRCRHNYYPRVAKTVCPLCEGKLRSVKKVMTCSNCGYKASELGCTFCGDKDNWEANPRRDPYLGSEVLPRLKTLEDELEKRAVELVQEHPLWAWARNIRGYGAVTLARVISACLIEKTETASMFKAHFGWGLRPDGTPQRKVKGEKLNYDSRAQSIAYMLGVAFQKMGTRWGSSYNEFYLKWKERYLAEGMSAGQASSRAYRGMLQLMLQHTWEVWRKGVGLPAPEPYPFTILQPPHDPSHKIGPWDMVDVKEPVTAGK